VLALLKSFISRESVTIEKRYIIISCESDKYQIYF
jgi:hypothetical protein